jgi:hypothetical protein
MFQNYSNKGQTPRVLFSAMDGIGGIGHGRTIEISMEKTWVSCFSWKWTTQTEQKKRLRQMKAGSARRVQLPNQEFIMVKPTMQGSSRGSGPKRNLMMNLGKMLAL